MDFLLVLIKLFSLGVTAEALRANIGSKSILLKRGLVDPKFQVDRVAPTNHSSSQKTRLNNLSYDIKIWTDLSSFLSQYTEHQIHVHALYALIGIARGCTGVYVHPRAEIKIGCKFTEESCKCTPRQRVRPLS